MDPRTASTNVEQQTAAEENAPVKKNLSDFVQETTLKPGERGFAILTIIFGALGYYFALGMTHDSLSAPSVFPKLASGIIMICGAVTLFKDIRYCKPADGKQPVWKFLIPKDVLFMLSCLIIYCVALPYIHFIAASYIFMVAGIIYLHHGKYVVKALIISAASLAVLVVIFHYIFMVILP